MGPRSIDRGNPPSARPAPRQSALQWGRDQLIAEMSSCRKSAGLFCLLQWGRDQLIAEMLTPPLAGPHSTRLQWGRDQLIAEIKTEALFRGDRSGFNGAAIN